MPTKKAGILAAPRGGWGDAKLSVQHTTARTLHGHDWGGWMFVSWARTRARVLWECVYGICSCYIHSPALPVMKTAREKNKAEWDGRGRERRNNGEGERNYNNNHAMEANQQWLKCDKSKLRGQAALISRTHAWLDCTYTQSVLKALPWLKDSHTTMHWHRMQEW